MSALAAASSGKKRDHPFCQALKTYIMDANAPENAGPGLKVVTADVIAGKTVLREWCESLIEVLPE